jgi:hypothetical protein
VVGSAPEHTTATSVVYKLAEATAKRAPKAEMLENCILKELKDTKRCSLNASNKKNERSGM